MKNLKIKFIPYERFRGSGLKTLMKDLKENTIIMVDAKLSADEEAALIKETMKKINPGFTGIELSSLDLDKQMDVRGLEKAKNWLVQVIAGKRRGLTIIGPAKLVHKIEKNPQELLLHI